MARKKQCNHKTARYDWGRDATGAEVAISRWCLGCGAQLGIGPSNEEPDQVQMDIDMAIARDIIGVNECDAWDDGDYFDFDQCDSDWSWDPSRPIADQLADTATSLIDVPPVLPADGDLSRLPVLDLDAMEYEVTRSAEPDCRDEDEDPIDGARSRSGHGYVYDGPPVEADDAVVCSCAGDALRSERCEGRS